MLVTEYRYYKGKYPILVLLKGKKQWRCKFVGAKPCFAEDVFVTIPRLCWKRMRDEK